jgi:hypothetical protein
MINSRSLFGRREAASRTVADALRRDAAFLWNAAVTLMFVAFAGLAVAAALFDLMSIRQ